MLFACNANNYVCSANCLRPVQVPSPRSMHADAAGAFCSEPGAGGLRLLVFCAANDMLTFFCMYSSVDMDRIHFEWGQLVLPKCVCVCVPVPSSVCVFVCVQTFVHTRFYLYSPTTRNFSVEVATTTATSFWV